MEIFEYSSLLKKLNEKKKKNLKYSGENMVKKKKKN